jgi:hypothetical protein
LTTDQEVAGSNPAERAPSVSWSVDPLTGRRTYLTEVVPLAAAATKQAERAARAEAKKVLTRPLPLSW